VLLELAREDPAGLDNYRTLLHSCINRNQNTEKMIKHPFIVHTMEVRMLKMVDPVSGNPSRSFSVDLYVL